ncbi:transcriptional repressor LexA [Geomonas azotofigens]|uniref:transcriptional repressor LexA n=1 Tax=Geomonas azotofigens TaxID=2843196 RepID=UPI001C11C6B6|nr:transcriptional repressor LexA [Geomonas azotofigens]MBU5614170.1 transcriptional repressor LexA [Geomonas azotofigens]
MTPKQKRVLDFILDFVSRHGYQPSQLEIAQGCGFESLGTVQHYLRSLERHGHLARRSNAKRGLQLSAPAHPAAEIAGSAIAPSERMELPLVGIVAAGQPVHAYELADAIEVPSAMAGPGNVVYEVRGDSMVEMGIMDGDYVAVHPQAVAENGQTVIAEVNGSITIKKYLRKGNTIQLLPANSAMSPITVTEEDEFHIRGVLVGSMRFYRKWTGKSST